MVVSTGLFQIVVSARRFLFALYLQNYDKARSPVCKFSNTF
ncbi:hypothetical protein ACKFKG_07565 [Phormidesmis sp. 146-35]